MIEFQAYIVSDMLQYIVLLKIHAIFITISQYDGNDKYDIGPSFWEYWA